MTSIVEIEPETMTNPAMFEYRTKDEKALMAHGDIVQINPNCKTNPMFGGCLMVVTDATLTGVMGYVQSLGKDGKRGGQAYIRLPFDEFEPTGGVVYWDVA